MWRTSEILQSSCKYVKQFEVIDYNDLLESHVICHNLFSTHISYIGSYVIIYDRNGNAGRRKYVLSSRHLERSFRCCILFFLKEITHTKQAWMIFHDFCRIGYIHIFLGGEIYMHTKTYYYNLYTIFLNQLCFEIVHLNKTTANSLMVLQ
jgi:hypothetical protein